MKQGFKASCLLLVVLLTATAVADESVPVQEDYAFGFAISIAEESSFYRLQLPLQVNQSVADSLLRDTAVFNSSGDPVPRIFVADADEISQVETSHPLPMLALYKSSVLMSDDIRMMFRRGDATTEVVFDSGPPLSPAGDNHLASYIIDIRDVDRPIRALDFTWPGEAAGFIGQITVDGSDDLETWQRIGGGAVAELRDNDASLEKRRLTLDRPGNDFLRITWQDLPDNWSLGGVAGISIENVELNNRTMLSLQPGATDPEDGGTIFDLGGWPQIDRLRVILPEPNTVMTATLHVWSDTRDRWIQTASESFHHLVKEQGVDISDAVHIGKIRVRLIKVVRLKGDANMPFHLEVGWRPDALVFLARGEPPYMLATGNGADIANDFHAHRNYADPSIPKIAREYGKTSNASLGARYSLGGTQRLVTPIILDWRTFILWLALALGVAGVGFMANTLVRELKTTKEKK